MLSCGVAWPTSCRCCTTVSRRQMTRTRWHLRLLLTRRRQTKCGACGSLSCRRQTFDCTSTSCLTMEPRCWPSTHTASLPTPSLPTRSAMGTRWPSLRALLARARRSHNKRCRRRQPLLRRRRGKRRLLANTPLPPVLPLSMQKRTARPAGLLRLSCRRARRGSGGGRRALGQQWKHRSRPFGSTARGLCLSGQILFTRRWRSTGAACCAECSSCRKWRRGS
mmetsp:Transcript_15004/g.58756  ORF Transcript_15004/g.58756 Transcript_15004/m.58756 type:complete len:222 (+) Transcript_15004:776-1441(+)